MIEWGFRMGMENKKHGILFMCRGIYSFQRKGDGCIDMVIFGIFRNRYLGPGYVSASIEPQNMGSKFLELRAAVEGKLADSDEERKGQKVKVVHVFVNNEACYLFHDCNGFLTRSGFEDVGLKLMSMCKWKGQ